VGEDQTIRHIDGREICCQHLAHNSESSRRCDHIRPGLRRMEHARRVVFYRIEPGGILVSRKLHQRMLPETQSIDEEESVNNDE
jgi:plasmid stabilization system protein ParE